MIIRRGVGHNMKKCGVFVLILMTSITLAFIPGMDKRYYGGEIWFFPGPGVTAEGMEGFYEEGFQLYHYKPLDIHIDVFFGPTVNIGYAQSTDINGWGVGYGFNPSIMLYKGDWMKKLFGYEVYPAFSINIKFYWNAVGVKVYGIEAGTQTAHRILNDRTGKRGSI